MKKIKVLFVCMGNICRSPTAEGVFAHLLAQRKLSDYFEIDSAGTHAYHINEAPDLRAQRAAKNRGIDLSALRARQISLADFIEFDYLLVMDHDNYEVLEHLCPSSYQGKVHYLMDYAPQFKTREVPDPYYGGGYGFERVLDLVEKASLGFLAAVQPEKEPA
jgi:protein-tyrosine phosphatase